MPGEKLTVQHRFSYNVAVFAKQGESQRAVAALKHIEPGRCLALGNAARRDDTGAVQQEGDMAGIDRLARCHADQVGLVILSGRKTLMQHFDRKRVSGANQALCEGTGIRQPRYQAVRDGGWQGLPESILKHGGYYAKRNGGCPATVCGNRHSGNMLEIFMLNSLIWLLGYQLAGELISRSLSLPVPGAVIGMLLLFATFCVRKTIPEHLKQTAPALLGHLSMLFIPVGVGLMVWRKMLETYAVSLLAIVLASTLITWVVSAVTLHWLKTRHTARGVQ